MNHLTQPLPFRGDKIYNDVIITNASHQKNVISFLLAAGDFGQSGSQRIKKNAHVVLRLGQSD